MRRFLFGCPALLFVVVALGAADDTPKAAATRKKLDARVTVNFKDALLRDVVEELKEKVEGLAVLVDTAGGVNLNTKVTLKADDKPLAEVLNGICDKYDMGYLIVSQQGGARDGNLKLTRNKEERGYAAGQAPKKTADKADDKAKDKEKKEAKKDEKPKPVEKAKAEERPADDPEKLETEAARRLKNAKALLDDKKTEQAKDKLEEIVKRYPKTKAGAEAKELLEKLDK